MDLGVLIAVEHQAQFDLQSVIEMARIEIDELLGFIEAVDEGVAVDVELLGRIGEIESASQESLDGLEELVVAEQGREDLVGQLGFAFLGSTGQSDKHADLLNVVDTAGAPNFGAYFQGKLGILVALAQAG